MNGRKLIMFSIIYGLLILKENQAKIVKKRGVMDNLNEGLKAAGQMFGINTAADVANLVAKAFSNNNNNNNRNKPDLFSFIQNGLNLSPYKPGSSGDGKHFEPQQNSESQEVPQQAEETTRKQFQTKGATAPSSKETEGGNNFSSSNLITSMLRLVGFDAAKLGALAINAIIMLASAIGNAIMGNAKTQSIVSSVDGARFHNKNPSLVPPTANENKEEGEEENAETGPEEKYSPNDHEPRAGNDATTIEWFLQNSSRKMKRILHEATRSDLSDKLIDMITSQESKEGQAACLKMLVCKSSPFIWGMQTSIRKHVEPNTNNEGGNLNDEDLKDNNADKRLFDVNNFFTHMPTVEEYREHGEKCEKLYTNHCNVKDLYDEK